MTSTTDRHEVQLAARDSGMSQTFVRASGSVKQLEGELKNAAKDAGATGTAMTKASRDSVQAADRAAAGTKKWSDAGRQTGVVLAALTLLSAKAAGDAEASQARLDTAFENSGIQIDDYADKIKALTKNAVHLAFDDEDAQDALARLITVTGDADKAIRDVAVAEDLARSQQISLAAATDLVAAAETGRYRGLRTLGITLDATATSEEAIAALQEKTAGSAERYAETGAATFEKYRIGIENALESIGSFTGQYQGVILLLSGTATAAGPAASALKAVGAAAKESAVAGAALDLAMGPVGVVLAVAAAGTALYLWTQRESDSEKATRALTQATEDYTHSIQDNITALAQAGTYDIAKSTEAYLTTIKANAQQAETRITALANAQELLLQSSTRLDATAQDNPWVNAVKAGIIDQYTADVLAANDANGDFVLSQDEIAAAMLQLQSGFDATDQQLADLTSAVTKVTNATSDPQLFGQQLAEDELKILQDLGAGYIDVGEAITRLNALPTNEKYNRELEKQKKSQEEVAAGADAVTESIYGGVTALAAVQPLLERFSQENRSTADAAFTATHNINLENAAIEAMTRGFAAGTSGIRIFAKGTGDAVGSVDVFTQQIADLNAALSDTGAEALNRYMGMIVDYTNGIAGATNKAQQWADALIAPRGTYSEMDTLLQKGKIGILDYVSAQVAQEQITGANARAQEAANVIQIKNASLIADQADAAADYITKLSEMTGQEQLLALAYADPATSDRVNQIAEMAAGYDDMTKAQQQAFEQTVLSAAATDPALAAMLESLGLIKKDINDPTGWSLDVGVGGQTEVDKIANSIGLLVEVLGIQYGLNIDTNDTGAVARAGLKAEMIAIQLGNYDASVVIGSDTTAFWNGVAAIPDSVANRYVDIYERYHQGYSPFADGGMIRDQGAHIPAAATGRMVTSNLVQVGEHGPELASLPYGTSITHAAATRVRGAGLTRNGPTDGLVFSGPITVVANSPADLATNTRPYRRAQARS